ncbi:hypothetical protein U879_15410 [Defluviimonas sp. 20V17]|nr:hypothetical protein U879_15410 [Defluviimonas sp. 20V17]
MEAAGLGMIHDSLKATPEALAAESPPPPG